MDSKIESIPESWNYDNKPTQILKGSATTTFTYDGNSQRVKKVSPNQNVLYFGELYEKRNEVGIMHVFAGNQRLASVRLDGTKQFYHTDHLGSTSIVTDQTGSKKEWNEFFPFGTYRVNIDYDASFPDVFHTYTGQEEDDELGLYNFKARLYDPVIGRFISPDSIVPDPDNPQSLNRYSYCRNNPLAYTDPSGHEEGGTDEGGFLSNLLSEIKGFWKNIKGFFGGSPSSTSSDVNIVKPGPESGIVMSPDTPPIKESIVEGFVESLKKLLGRGTVSNSSQDDTTEKVIKDAAKVAETLIKSGYARAPE